MESWPRANEGEIVFRLNNIDQPNQRLNIVLCGCFLIIQSYAFYFVFLFFFFHFSLFPRPHRSIVTNINRESNLAVSNIFNFCCGILLTPLRWFKQIKRTVCFDVTTRFNAIQQSTAIYNSHIFNVRNATINVTKRSTINDQLKHSKYTVVFLLSLRPRGGTWVNVCWVCAAGLSEPLPHYSLFFGQL